MRIAGIIWLNAIVEKLAVKHHVAPYEVEETLNHHPKFRFVARGEREGEDVYMALGQTDAGGYVTVIFIYQLTVEALIMSARDMADKERRQYGKNNASPLPHFGALRELVDFFESHDMGDY